MNEQQIFPEIFSHEIVGHVRMNDTPLLGKRVQDGRRIGVIIDETSSSVGVQFKGRGFKVTYYNKKDLEVNDEKAIDIS